MKYDFNSIDKILQKAFNENRYSLFEHEVYEILKIMGIKTLDFEYVPIAKNVKETDLDRFGDKNVVLKVVSALITHKTEAGGVKLNLKISDVQNAVDEMKKEVPVKYSGWLIKNREMAKNYSDELLDNPEKLKKYLSDNIDGFLIIEQADYKPGLGNEILMGVKNDDAFGSVIMFGIGGTKVDFYNENFIPGRAFNIASADLLSDGKIENFIKRPVIHSILSGEIRGEKKIIEDSKIIDAVKKFRDLKIYYSNLNEKTKWNIIECEVNPFIITNGNMLPLDGVLKFDKADYRFMERPYHKLENLLNPETVGIVGVSGKRMTPGTIILINLLKSGFSPKNIFLLHPSEEEIRGCKCYPSFDSIKEKAGDKKIDMFVVGVPAIAPPGRAADDVIEQLINMELTESITIITSGFGETEKGKDKSEKIRKMFIEAHKKQDGGPIANGPNTLGNVYYNINTKFTPHYKSNADRTGKQNCALICQSGAFMITRQSDLSGILNPPVAIGIGNQIDLTMSDYMKFLKGMDEIDVYGVYIEGFSRLDGIEFIKTASEIIRGGKAVVVYKAGKTPEGKSAAQGHTAAAAGDYIVSKTLFEDAGIYVAEGIEEFQDILKLFSMLSGTKLDYSKKIAGVGALSNAGFEKCAIGDNINDENNNPYFKIAELAAGTLKSIEDIFLKLKITDFMDISEILDLSPIANDEAYALIIETLLQDNNLDAGIFSIVPETVMLTTLDGIKNENIYDENSIVQRLLKIKKNTGKPFIVPVESGKLYEPMRRILQENDIPVFAYVDHAVKMFGKYLRYRLKTGI